MFERGRKDENRIDAGEPAKGASHFRQDVPAARTSGRSGEAAVIGRSIKINGDLRGDEDLRIEGDVSGTVELKNSNLTIGKEGKVRADVYAKAIAVDGTIEGDLFASERVTVHINAQVRGNITSPKVGIEEGARFKGSIEMDPSAVEKALGKSNLQGAAKSGDDKALKPDNRSSAKNGAKDTTAGSPAGAA